MACMNGHGVAKDAAAAYQRLLLASAKGDEGAKSFLAMIIQVMTPEQRAEGQRMALEFKPRKKSK